MNRKQTNIFRGACSYSMRYSIKNNRKKRTTNERERDSDSLGIVFYETPIIFILSSASKLILRNIKKKPCCYKNISFTKNIDIVSEIQLCFLTCIVYLLNFSQPAKTLL